METFNEYLDVAVNNLLEIAVEQPEIIRNIVNNDINITYDEFVIMLHKLIIEFHDNPEWTNHYNKMIRAIQLLNSFGQPDVAEKLFDSFGAKILGELCTQITKTLLKPATVN